ncbi:DUF1876 family protein [Streptomyces sp. SP17BM10]|uniref:dsRBD fold-containing protein n=1 Tax=Streptomyces sp. SP17BM10 TaxID=3002530 RepID=UPI002E767170|nr:dsRBD fold-containing protein [Streptomyces sp. SP17BM10]MEE1786693.1 DUF1876 family protein [Streptomyces sp. SP17BM10]
MLTDDTRATGRQLMHTARGRTIAVSRFSPQVLPDTGRVILGTACEPHDTRPRPSSARKRRRAARDRGLNPTRTRSALEPRETDMTTNSTTTMRTKRWTLRLDIFEEGDDTKVHAVLDTGDNVLESHTTARRSPHDPPVPEIGDEYAAARALIDLGHRLLRAGLSDSAANAPADED